MSIKGQLKKTISHFLVQVTSGGNIKKTCLLLKNISSVFCPQICCLGAVGFVCLMVKAAITAFWAIHGPYFRYSTHGFHLAAAELTARGITTIFLMVLFLKVNARSLAIKNPDVKINYVLVPVMMLGILADFIASMIDQNVGPIDKRLRFVTGYSRFIVNKALTLALLTVPSSKLINFPKLQTG